LFTNSITSTSTVCKKIRRTKEIAFDVSREKWSKRKIFIFTSNRSSQEQTNPSHSQDENDVTMTEHDPHSTSIHQNHTTMSDNNGYI
jgi:hypothetical protein